MFKNYLKIAYRHLIRNKLFSFINLISLTLGFAICIIISLWVNKELSFDTYHEKSDRIYRVERELFRENAYSRWPIVGGQYKQALIDDFPEIENATRLWRRTTSIKDYQNITHTEASFATDNSIFEIFDFPLIKGNKQNALTEPRTLVLTKELALKYFNSEDVIGKYLTLEIRDEPTDFEVTGVLADIPENSHFHFNMLISIATYPEDYFSSWRSNYLYTYVLTKENIKIENLEAKLKIFTENHLEAHYGDLLAQGFGIHKVLKLHLNPITKIHLNPSEHWEIEPGGNAYLVNVFISVAILILLIGCINYINLTTARSMKRHREISIRKTVGADKTQIIYQFLLESFIYVILALILAFVIDDIILIHLFEKIFNESLPLSYFFQSNNILYLISIILFIGFATGIYPALLLSKFEPIQILSGLKSPNSHGSRFKQNMVIVQFTISIFLIISMIAVYKQINLIKNHDLGFEQENVVVLSARGSQINQSYEAFKNELTQNPQIIAMSRTSDLPGEVAFSTTNFRHQSKPDDSKSMIVLGVDYDFIPTFKMSMMAGRNFSKQFGSDTTGTILLNETAAKILNWTPEEGIDKKLQYGRNSVGNVVGVIKDFNLKSMHSPIEPIALLLNTNWVNEISIRIVGENIQGTISKIENIWRKHYTDEQFSYSFLDDNIQKLYSRENKLYVTFNIFTVISIIIASLGILGLIIYTSETKVKEIGIRKVLGASFFEIILLFNKKIIIWVLVSNIIACPIAWFAINKWLQHFVYKISMDVFVYISAALIALCIALITTSYHSIKAATANPVESLRYE